ncbi:MULTISPECIES: ubiquinone anaerobic biosynthesis protein UbiU [Pseudomonas]|uniref:Ubiquinone biosynthesis protein UbiU n=1 Tax=Pseudomonas rhodesiae TaxID=76760 RepID=A0A8I1E0U5_9PSED|nr:MULTISPECIES: peptidase U32 family protein [Pseudomonas]MBI6602888.1 U32 family peptidase [Pseudomonas sp. S4_EA_1b]MBI6622918.1 U32 family peptidase [Pseudomonas rhodesiae]NMY79531.1 U32 family peptidase [Pseudomonas rhodesiae]WHT78305.1 putative protease YhbU [Pseudomonas rhodesiae]
MQLVCPAGNLPALKAAVRQGADAVYVGFRDDTNARHFAGLNMDDKQFDGAVAFIRQHQRKLYVAVNTYPQPKIWARWQRAVDRAADHGVDALIAADPGVLDYAHRHHPQMALHLSVQGSATHGTALKFYAERYDIRRAVLPRVLSLAQVKQVAASSPVPIEVFGFGSLCIMAEGRCHLSSYITGESPNLCGVCSPAKAVRWSEDADGLSARLSDVLIDRYTADEPAGYPTLCKGRFLVEGKRFHALEEPTSLDTLDLLPELSAMGVAAIKIEGRQRSPAYVEQVTRVWRAALDAHCLAPARFAVQDQWRQVLAGLSEGSQTTLGAYHRAWQ